MVVSNMVFSVTEDGALKGDLEVVKDQVMFGVLVDHMALPLALERGGVCP